MAIDGVADRINLSHLGLRLLPLNVDGMPVGGVTASNNSVGNANHDILVGIIGGIVVHVRFHVVPVDN